MKEKNGKSDREEKEEWRNDFQSEEHITKWIT